MNKNVIRYLVLTCTFFVSIFGFSVAKNKVNIDLTASMEEATLPVVHFEHNEVVLSELYGYVREMDLLSMRDDVLPIPDNRSLTLCVDTYGTKVDTLGYEIRSLDGSRLLVEKDALEFKNEGDELRAEMKLPSLLEEDEEYHMILTLSAEGKTIHYYTRVMLAKDKSVEECLSFAMQFHEYTFRDDAADFIPNYMDPATGDATTLSYVDLSCTLRQITWGLFDGARLTEPVVSFKEISDIYNVLTIRYVVTYINDHHETEFYNVEEYYRLRQTPTRMYVLNFERRMNQIFRGENDFLSGNSAILLGIREEEVEYLGNDTGTHVAFVQEGALWSYDRKNNVLSEVFNYRGLEGIDSRENLNRHEVRVLRLDEAGSIDFAVYGYFNRGSHEGEVGLAVYRYDGIAHTVEELYFTPSNQSYEQLKAQLGTLMYINEQDDLYFVLNEDIYCINLASLEQTCIIQNETGKEYAFSESGRYLAWVDADQYDSSPLIRVMDLKTGQTGEIRSQEGTYLRPIAFMGEDFVYGVAYQEDVIMDAVGNTQFPMCAIEIVTFDEGNLTLAKRYAPEGKYVDRLTIEDKNIHVELVQKSHGRLVAAGTDTIMNREPETSDGFAVGQIKTDLKQRQVIISMKAVTTTDSVRVTTPKYVIVDKESADGLDRNPDSEMYYVYQRGQVLLATADVSEAVICANKNYGVVVDREMNYIYKRARSTTKNPLKNLAAGSADAKADGIAKCLSAMLRFEEKGLSVNELMQAGQTPSYILATALKDARVLELNGCGVDELLYYVDQGSPVLAKTGDTQAVLLIGYTSSKIYYYDPVTEKTKSVSYKEMDEMLDEGNNYFLLYLK